GYGLPSLLNLQSEASVMQARAKEATPAGKLDVPHVIGLRRSRHNFDSCDAMCQMLLYGSSVERVVWVPTNEKGRNRAPRSFRVERGANCPDAGKLLQGNGWDFGNSAAA